MVRPAGLLIVMALVVGCVPAVDSTQYKPYDQLPEGAAKIDLGAAHADAESPLEPTFAAETDPSPGEVQPPASATEVLVASALASDAEKLTAPTMKVVNGKVVVQTLPGGVRLLVPEHDFKVEGPNGAVRVTYEDLDLLRILNMDPVTEDAVEHFPDWLKSLHGKRVRIRGFMLPTYEATGLEQFVLARDTGACCFGPQAKLYYLIIVQLQSGKTTEYIANRAFDVVGTFRIEMLADGGKPIGLYWIDDAQMIER